MDFSQAIFIKNLFDSHYTMKVLPTILLDFPPEMGEGSQRQMATKIV
jgi:hypothetical protein